MYQCSQVSLEVFKAEFSRKRQNVGTETTAMRGKKGVHRKNALHRVFEVHAMYHPVALIQVSAPAVLLAAECVLALRS